MLRKIVIIVLSAVLALLAWSLQSRSMTLYEEHGVYVPDLERKGGTSKLDRVYKTQGVVISADISPDGKYIAAIEAPVKLESGEIIGEHRLIILT